MIVCAYVALSMIILSCVISAIDVLFLDQCEFIFGRFLWFFACFVLSILGIIGIATR
jgi:hypothetical protein